MEKRIRRPAGLTALFWRYLITTGIVAVSYTHLVEKSNLDDHAFKEKIIAALKEESYA